MKSFLKLLLLLNLILLSACGVKSYAPGEIPKTQISNIKESEQTAKGLTSNFNENGIRVYRSGRDYNRVKKITNRLLPATELPLNSFPILILDSNELNAGVYEGKTILVYKGLINLVENDDQLASVLAHELGHVLADHHNDDGEKERTSFLSIGSTILGTVASVATTYYTGSSDLGNVAGDVTGTATAVVGYGAFVKSYSRGQEYQADDIGLSIMVKAGYDPNEAIKLWNLMEKNNVGDKTAFFSTHPKSRDRAERIKDRIPETIKNVK